MIFVFIALEAVLSAAFIIFGGYLSQSLTVIYAAAMLLSCAAFTLYTHIRLQRTAHRLTALTEGNYRGEGDDALSGAERILALRLREDDMRRAKLAESYKNLSSLISDIAHQCKTPLSSVILCAQAMPDDENSRAVRTQSEKLGFLLEALTKLSKCESGLINGSLHICPADVGELIRLAAGDALTPACEKNIRLKSQIPDGLCARFDMRWTREALFNIIINAVKYSPAGSDIEIRAAKYDMFVRIDISDRGPGIAEEERPKIWRRFYRGAAAEAEEYSESKTGGVGIGLYLTRSILTAEGGRALVSPRDGGGSVFSVFLPSNNT